MYKIKIEQFEGPLDLLLRLIEEQRLDITQMSLSSVTDQYIKILDKSPEISPNDLADFLVVAAKLLLIKSKTLLPYLSTEEEDLGSDLETQLKMYQLYYEAAKKLSKVILRGRYGYFREASRLLTPIFVPPKGIGPADLCGFFRGILKNIEPIIQIPKEAVLRTISIRDKISQIKEFIAQAQDLNFNHLVTKAKSRTEIIVTFLALLELVKQRDVMVVQENIFSEITIKKLNNA